MSRLRLVAALMLSFTLIGFGLSRFRRSPAPVAADEQLLAWQRSKKVVQVDMYSTSWCGYCRQARAWLTAEGIEYTDHDIERDPVARARADILAPGGGVPLFEVGHQVVHGFDPGSILAALEAARR